MYDNFKFGLSVAPEIVSASAPIVFGGDIFDIIQKCHKIGYDGVELQLRNPEQLDSERVLQECERFNMNITAIATGLEYSLNGLSMIDEDESIRAKLRERLYLDIKMAERFGCPVIIGCIRGNIPDGSDGEKYLKRFREEMLVVASKAAEHNVTLVIEAINFYVNNYLNSIKETCDFIDSLNLTNVKLHIDTHHMAIQEKDMLDAIEYAGNRIGYVHFAENNRLYPGANGLDFLGVMQKLVEINYKGFIVLEVVPIPNGEICAERSFEYLKILCDTLSFKKENSVKLSIS